MSPCFPHSAASASTRCHCSALPLLLTVRLPLHHYLHLLSAKLLLLQCSLSLLPAKRPLLQRRLLPCTHRTHRTTAPPHHSPAFIDRFDPALDYFTPSAEYKRATTSRCRANINQHLLTVPHWYHTDTGQSTLRYHEETCLTVSQLARSVPRMRRHSMLLAYAARSRNDARNPCS